MKTTGWLTIKESCLYAGVCRDTFCDWMADGLAHSRIGKNIVRIKPDSIDQYIKRFESRSDDLKAMVGEVMTKIRRAK